MTQTMKPCPVCGGPAPISPEDGTHDGCFDDWPEVVHDEADERCTCWGCERGRQAHEQFLTFFPLDRSRWEDLPISGVRLG